MLELKTDIELKIKARLQHIKDVQGTVDTDDRTACEGELEAYIDVLEMIREREKQITKPSKDV